MSQRTGSSERTGGFAIRWQMKGQFDVPQDNTDAEIPGHWTQKNEPNSETMNVNLMSLLNLVTQTKINKIQEKMLWDSLLKHRWTKDIVDNSTCLTEDQEFTVIRKAAQELGLVYGVSSWVPDEDLALGLKLYSITHMCPPRSVEAVKLSEFFNSLVATHNLNTIVSTTMHNIQPTKNLIDFSAINMWYQRLDKRYNFSLGPAILPMLTSATLLDLSKLDPPYLKDYTDLNEQKYENLSSLFGKK